MSGRLDSSLHAHLLALAFTAAAVAIRWAADPWLGDSLALITLPAAVAAAVWNLGPRPARLAAVAGYLTCDYLFLGGGWPGPHDVPSAAELLAYVVSCAIIIGFAADRRQTRASATEHVTSTAAEEIRASLAAIVETSDDAIVSKSLDGTLRSWNPGAERLFGYTAAEVLGQSVNVIIPPERRDEERAILERLRRGEHVEHFDTVRVTKDGGRIDISLSVSPVFNASGQIIGAAKIARDVTSQKRAAAALRFSEERFRELANNIDQFAWTCTELGYTTWYNQRWYDYTGSTFEETRGDGWKSIHDPAHVDRVVARMKASVVTGEPWEDTFPLRGKDGRYRWFLSRAIPIRDERGHVVRWFGTNTDITEQRQLEQELRAADRRKDEFLATLAHELRNPLAPLRNALEILNLAGSDPDLIDEARSIMDRQLTHLVRLVDDLLDVSRITRDRLELRKSTVELNAAVEQAVSVQRSLMEELGLTIDVTPAAQPVHLSADPVRLTQILTNLLNNAVRYTSHGGRVSVIVERHGEQAIVTVRDTGIGIPSDQLENIFEMFTQAEESHHGAHVGLGIGLTLVKRLAELHGGHVEAHSEGLGMGSEFVVRLPGLSAPAEDKPAPANAERPHLASRRVLVVEDNVDSAATLEALLKIAGHETRVAHDGPEAVEQAEAFRPEVVLLDLGLPKMGGLEVCRWVRAQPWSERVTVVALTGWGQDTDRRRTSEAGFDDHLVKPVDPEKVLGLVASLPSRPAPVRSGAVH